MCLIPSSVPACFVLSLICHVIFNIDNSHVMITEQISLQCESEQLTEMQGHRVCLSPGEPIRDHIWGHDRMLNSWSQSLCAVSVSQGSISISVTPLESHTAEGTDTDGFRVQLTLCCSSITLDWKHIIIFIIIIILNATLLESYKTRWHGCCCVTPHPPKKLNWTL